MFGKNAEFENSFIADDEDEIADIVAKKNVIDQEIALIYEQMDNLNQQITVYNGLIADKQEELEQAAPRGLFGGYTSLADPGNVH